MACKYLYNGTKYTRTQALTLIRDGVIKAPLNEVAARQWLNEKLGLEDDQVKIVKGLLDNGAFGRFLKDGKLLMSNELDGVQYHEAFHRVFRMLLSKEQQQALIDEFNQRADSKLVLENITKRYPESSQATRVEEALAEEYMYYTLNDGRYPVPEQTKTIFDRIISFFKRLFGITDNLSIRELYDAINVGRYAGVQPLTYDVEQADMLFLTDGSTIGVEEKNEIMSFLFSYVTSIFTHSETLYDFLDGNMDKDVFQDVLVQGVIDMLSPETEEGGTYNLYETNFDLSMSLVKDLFGDVEELTYDTPLRQDSKFLRAFADYTAQYSIKLGKLDGDGTVKKLEDIDSVENEENQQGDNAFMKVSFEFDPRGNLSTAIKLLMASIQDINQEGTVNPSPLLNLPRTVSYNEATKIIYHTLAGTPNTFERVIEKLQAKAVDFPFINEIIDTLTYDESVYTQRLRNEFMAGFVKNRYTFVKSHISRGEHRFINISDASQGGKYTQLWRNRLELAQYDPAQLATELRGARDVSTIATLMGFDELGELDLLEEVFDENSGETVAERLNIIAQVAARALDENININELYDFRNDDTDIRTSVRLLGEFVADRGIPFDMLLLNSERKRIFAISEHTYQTIIEGHLNDIASEVRGIRDIQERRSTALERIRQELPHLLHIENFDGTNVRSVFLKSVMDGVPVKLFVEDGVDAYNSNEIHFSKIGYTDYISQYVNNILHNRLLGFKHGDRKVVYGYELQRPFVDQIDYDSIINDAITLAAEYLFDEVRRIRAIENNPKLIEGLALVDSAKKLQHFDSISYDKIKNAKNAQDVLKATRNDLRNFFVAQSDKLHNAMRTSGLLKVSTHGIVPKADGSGNTVQEGAGKPIGIDSSKYDDFLKTNNEKAVDAIAAFVATNYFFGFIEQMRVFIGEPYNYKSFIDFYKRAQMQSSTGTTMAYGPTIDAQIAAMNARDTFTIDGKQYTYGEGDLKRIGYMSEVVIYDQDVSASSATNQIYESVIDQRPVSMVEYLTEKGTLAETNDPAIAKARAEQNRKAMERYEEADGMSWINMFMWREYMYRVGKWSSQKENTFQIELAVLEAENIADTTVYVDLNDKGTFYSKPGDNRVAVKIFDVQDVQDKINPRKGAESYLTRHTDYATVLKPQYTGPFSPNDPLTSSATEQLNLIAGRKTAYMVLMPSTIKGTKLELMNKIMLRNGLDGQHMGTAAKYGRKAKVDGMVLYDKDGNYNEAIEELLSTQVSYLNLKYHKDQVNVSTKPKQEIKNATQSVKTVLQNMFSDGVPVDFNEDNWDTLSEQDKRNASPIYNTYADYRDALYNFVSGAANDLSQELGDGNTLVRTLRKAVRDRQEAMYVVESVEAFIENESIDTIPNSSRVENILYSLVTRGAISLYRPGNGVPQVTTSLWEAPDVQRSSVDGVYTTDEQATSFYQLKEDGSLTPAKVIAPLEPKMIPMFLNRFGTTNIMVALERYRNLPDEEKFVFKSLRIPNQQFSFNDVFLVDRYTSPLTQSFVVVPSEIVPKTDADFDLDKQQLYGYARDENGYILRADKRDTDEGALARMRQWKSIGKLFLDDPYSTLYDDRIETYRDYRHGLLQELRVLKFQVQELHENADVVNPKSEINIRLMDELIDIQEQHDVGGESIWDTISDVRSQLDDIVRSGIWQEERFKDLLSAKRKLFSLFDPERKQMRALKADKQEVYDQLKDLYETIEGIELVDFMDRYPTVSAQTHAYIRHNELLDAEIKLLLSAENAHKMISSADDSYLAKQEFHRVVSKLDGVSEQEVRSNEEEFMLGKMNSGEFLSVDGNAKRAVLMISSKSNVGPVALSITHHNIGQVDGAQLKPTFNIIEQGKVIAVSSKLPFAGKNEDFSMSKMLTEDNQYILDLFSILLTAQVDGVNKPYAPRMNLSDVTLPVVLMLLRRGVAMPTILNLINNPLVRHFIAFRNINDSLVVTATGHSQRLGVKLGNQKMLKEFLVKEGIDPKAYDKFYYAYRNGKGNLIDTSKLEDRLGQRKMKGIDIKALAAFNLLELQANSLLKTVKDMTPDTKPQKSRSDIVSKNKNAIDVDKNGITTLQHREGFLKPFYGNQRVYEETFDRYYKLPHETLDNIAESIGAHLRSEDFTKMRNKLNDDFQVFLLQNFVQEVSQYSSDSLLKGSNSFIHELEQMSSDNYALRMLLQILNIGVDPNDSKAIHNVKIIDQGVATVSINDMYEEFQLLDDITQEKLIATSLYQAGLSNSPFSLRPILNVARMNGLLQDAMNHSKDAMANHYEQFVKLFLLNNPQFLPPNRYLAKVNKMPLYHERGVGERFYTVRKTDGNGIVPVRGNMSPALLNYKLGDMLSIDGLVPTVEEEENFTDKPVDTPIINDDKCSS